jgi:hypothetical protein
MKRPGPCGGKKIFIPNGPGRHVHAALGHTGRVAAIRSWLRICSRKRPPRERARGCLARRTRVSARLRHLAAWGRRAVRGHETTWPLTRAVSPIRALLRMVFGNVLVRLTNRSTDRSGAGAGLGDAEILGACHIHATSHGALRLARVTHEHSPAVYQAIPCRRSAAWPGDRSSKLVMQFRLPSPALILPLPRWSAGHFDVRVLVTWGRAATARSPAPGNTGHIRVSGLTGRLSRRYSRFLWNCEGISPVKFEQRHANKQAIN